MVVMDPKSNSFSPVLADTSPADKSRLCLSDLLPQSARAAALSTGLYRSIPRKKALVLSDVRSSGWLDAMKCSSPPPQMKTRDTSNHQSSTEDIDDTYHNWIQKYPSALASFEQIMNSAMGKRIVLFLDYDGTLSPIVDNPDHAFMSDSMRAALQNVAKCFPTAIISGRSRDKVLEFVGLTELYYAGSHGLDIMSPHMESFSTEYSSFAKSANMQGKEIYLFQPANEFLSMIDKVFRALVKITEEIDGVIIENNKFCASVHYRNVDEKNWAKVAHCVHEVMKDFPRLQLTHGRKVLELRPQINWDKGKAVMFVLESLGLRNLKDVVSIYIGDDRTDEDAFKVLKEGNHGYGILVSSVPKETNAYYTLKDPLEVMQFLQSLVRWKKAGAVGVAFPIKK